MVVDDGPLGSEGAVPLSLSLFLFFPTVPPTAPPMMTARTMIMAIAIMMAPRVVRYHGSFFIGVAAAPRSAADGSARAFGFTAVWVAAAPEASFKLEFEPLRGVTWLSRLTLYPSYKVASA